MTLTLRYMRQSDIPQVVVIDHQAFFTPWSARSYVYEISESSYSHMLTLEIQQETSTQGIKKLIRNFSPNGNGSGPARRVIGYGGLWHIVDEAHISTIAVHQDWRGRKYGELLLGAMIKRSITLGAEYIVLEVRVSNTVAQKLYQKYEFEITERKTRYYRDDGEDAYNMRLNLEDKALCQRFEARYEALKTQFTLTDYYSSAETQKPNALNDHP